MRVGELSRATGVPVATIKFYLREGLLPAGRPTAATQARYDDRHVQRLSLIRALTDVGGLSLAEVGAVVAALDRTDVGIHEVVGIAHRALGPPTDDDPADGDLDVEARSEVDAYLDGRGWRIGVDAPARGALAEVLATARRLGRSYGTEVFDPYADAAEQLAAVEIASLDGDAPPAEIVERVVVGTVVFEAALTALRRLAQEDASARRFGR